MKKYYLSALLISISLSTVLAQTIVTSSDVDVSDISDSSSSCTVITSNISYKNRKYNNKEDVLSLQDFLNDKGYLSSDSITGFFGRATEKAVATFQKDYGLVATPAGFVGQGTRAKIKSLSCSDINTDTNNPYVSTLPQGCTSSSGFSPVTGVSCSSTNNTQISTLPHGCTSTSGYSATTGSSCGGGEIACTMEMRFCSDGSPMPRGPGCGWHPEQCSDVTNPTPVSSIPAMTGFSPGYGSIGTKVIINGSGFTQDSKVIFEGTEEINRGVAFETNSIFINSNTMSFIVPSIGKNRTGTTIYCFTTPCPQPTVDVPVTSGNYRIGIVGQGKSNYGNYVVISDPQIIVPTISKLKISSITAFPSSTVAGQSSTISWSSVNAVSCWANGVNGSDLDWMGASPFNGKTNGSVVVAPTVTTTYGILCNSSTGSNTDAKVTVTVTPTTTVSGVSSLTATTDASSPDAAINDDTGTKIMANYKFVASGNSFSITDLTFTIGDVTTASVMSLYDGNQLIASRPVLNSTTFNGLSLRVPAGQSKILSVRIHLGTVGAGAGTSGASTLVTLTSGIATSDSGSSAAILESNPAGTAQYTYKAIPTVALVPLPTTALVTGNNTIAKFSVNTNGSGTIGWNRMIFRIAKSSAPIIGSVVLRNADTNIVIPGRVTLIDTANTASCGMAVTECRLMFVPTNEYQVSGANTYVLEATITGALATAEYITTTLAAPSVYSTPAAYAAVAGTPSTYAAFGTTPSFIWSDVSADSHDLTTLDWNNDFLVRSLPLSSQTLTKSVTAMPTISVLSPNGGSFKPGDVLNIQWIVPGQTNYNNSVGLSIYQKSRDNAAGRMLSVTTSNTLVNGQVTDKGSYNWTIPANISSGSDYVVYVSNSTQWVESNTFSITTSSSSLMSSSVNQLYKIFLGRDSESESNLVYLNNRLSNGTKINDLAWEFLTSPESIARNGNALTMPKDQYVELLYKIILGRSSDIDGKKYWNDAIDAGTTRGEVFKGFMDSSESKSKNTILFSYNNRNNIAFNVQLGKSVVLGDSTSCVKLPFNLHRGQESDEVKTLQTFLAQKNLLSKNDVTGVYRDKTVEAVKDYQASKGLPMTGMVYDFTRKAIENETCR
ncbi:MAG: peptidoglycan-binding protein [Candidatus Pacebacteria bacterium]|nr:peptidoglycan-binding protein [Candidatus Paceibacterota bacterium]MBP9867230.1 peptidoglycan-binding protein [Candidatus Paceibacterota bacterium]